MILRLMPCLCLGSPIDAKNWRGTRLFGWKGCDSGAKDTVVEAWNDFAKIASQEGLYKNIDWNSQAAKDIWGHGTGNKAISKWFLYLSLRFWIISRQLAWSVSLFGGHFGTLISRVANIPKIA